MKLLGSADGNITALLDWEYAKSGDPAQDLGYAQEAVSRHLDWARFIDVYREAGGPEEGGRKTKQIPVGKNPIDAPLIGR